MCVLCVHCCGMVVSLAGGCLIHSGPCSWRVSIFEVFLDASICWHLGSRPPTLKHKFSNLFHLQILRFLADVWLNITAFPTKCAAENVYLFWWLVAALWCKKPLLSFSHLLGDVANVCGLYGILLVCTMDGLKTHHVFFFGDVSTHIGERGNFELARNHLKILVGAQKCMYEFKQFHKQNAPSKKESTWNFRSFS